MRKILLSLLIVLSSSGMSGCATYEITPKPTPITRSTPQHVDTYSFKLDSYRNDENLENLLLSSTNNILDHSVRVSEPSFEKANKETYHLEILVKKNSSYHQASGAEFLTGLSLGLIPSSYNSPGIYIFAFTLLKNGKACKLHGFSVNETSYAHILLLPVGLIQMAYGKDRVANRHYEDSLKSVIRTGCGNQ